MAEKELRIIFMGTPEFAVASLEALIQANQNVVAVITAPDKPKGRGQKVIPSPVKLVAEEHSIPVLQPTNLKAPAFIEELKNYHAKLQVVVAFRMLPEVVWSMPEYGTFNLHASLLPQYRGAAPINWAIINGEKETGVSTFLLKHEIDTGSILLQEKEPIYADDNVGSLYGRLMHKGARLVVETVKKITAGNYELMAQPESEEGLKKAPKIFKEDCEIDWSGSSYEIINFVRGLSPYPGAWTVLNGKQMKVYWVQGSSRKVEGEPGSYDSDDKTFLSVKTGDGVLDVTDLQLEGKKRMLIGDLLRGNKI